MTETKEIKTIRVKNNTYQKLVSHGTYSDSMDVIINKILNKIDLSSDLSSGVDIKK